MEYRVTIKADDLREEINDKAELMDQIRNGPLYRLSSGTNIRVEHTGTVVDGDDTYEFKLVGFGKRDRQPQLSLNPKDEKAIREFMGKSWMSVTISHKQELRRVLETTKVEDLLAVAKGRRKSGDGRLMALNKAIIEGVGRVSGKPMTDQELRAIGL